MVGRKVGLTPPRTCPGCTWYPPPTGVSPYAPGGMHCSGQKPVPPIYPYCSTHILQALQHTLSGVARLVVSRTLLVSLFTISAYSVNASVSLAEV